jgi:hypothetical protein
MTLSNTMAYPSILLTKFSANSEYSPNTSSEATQSLSNDLRDDSHVLRTGKTVQAILVAVFPVLMLSCSISPVSSCRTPSGTMPARE